MSLAGEIALARQRARADARQDGLSRSPKKSGRLSRGISHASTSASLTPTRRKRASSDTDDGVDADVLADVLADAAADDAFFLERAAFSPKRRAHRKPSHGGARPSSGEASSADDDKDAMTDTREQQELVEPTVKDSPEICQSRHHHHAHGPRHVVQHRVTERSCFVFLEVGLERFAELFLEMEAVAWGVGWAKVLLLVVGTFFLAHLARHDWHGAMEAKRSKRLLAAFGFIVASALSLLDIMAHLYVAAGHRWHWDHHVLHDVERVSLRICGVSIVSAFVAELLVSRSDATTKEKHQ
eukprot:TRINITY_DN7578_c0_g1_i1.p1 TRINITY_DN7578_c0_g1~~TRINITY_DN7578_c0_g1_i1.p1  ORF type:complete len:298 (+),score=54.79 TRINITY_DN7578_c0_g1_i1:72-965(+)